MIGIAGALLFMRSVLPRFGGAVLDRVFRHDAVINIETFASLQQNLLEGPQGRGLYDWLYAAPFVFPQPRGLILSESMPLAALVTLPLAGHPVFIHNLLLFVALVLDCVAGATFARVIGAKRLPAALAGVAFAFSAYTNFSSARVQLIFLFPLAYAFTSLIDWSRSGMKRDGWKVGAWTLAQLLLCQYYGLFLALLLPPAALVLRLSQRRDGVVREFIELGTAVLLTAIPGVVMLWPYRALSAHLGIARTLAQVDAENGDPWMFLWADASTLAGRYLKDVYRWDTAYFPGIAVTIVATITVVAWLRRSPRSRSIALAPIVVGCLLFPIASSWSVLLGGAGTTILLMRQARKGLVSPMIPFLVATCTAALVIYFGPHPRFMEKHLVGGPWLWMFEHVPFVDGLRTVRRAGLIIDLALAASAAWGLSQLPERRWSTVVTIVAIGIAFVEGIPFNVGAQPVSNTCTDEAYAMAQTSSEGAVAELVERDPSHEQLVEFRRQARLCGLQSGVAQPGFKPRIVDVSEDMAAALPDPTALARLRDAGFGSVAIRSGDPRWRTRKAAELGGVTRQVIDAGPHSLAILGASDLPVFEPLPELAGPRVVVRTIECSSGDGCGLAIDGSLSSRWATGVARRGGEAVVLRFDAVMVAGVVWRVGDAFGDLPSGVRVESSSANGEWQEWAEFKALSYRGLRTEAVKVSAALPLPPREVSAIRLTALGRSTRFWLSATELEVVGPAK